MTRYRTSCSSGCRRCTASATSRSAAARCRRCAWSCCRTRSTSTASRWRTCAPRSRPPTPTGPRATVEGDGRRLQIYTRRRPRRAADYRAAGRRLAQRRGGAPRRRRARDRQRRRHAHAGPVQRRARDHRAHHAPARRQRHPDRRRACARCCRSCARSCRRRRAARRLRRTHLDPRLAARDRGHAADLARAGGAGGERFLRSVRATIVPAVATVVSLLGTFGVMYLLGFSLNNLCLMALTVATGFVVDDAIVVLENTTPPHRAGMEPLTGGAAGRARSRLHGAVDQHLAGRGVHSAAVHGRHVGRLFREFAVTLSAAVMISLVISLTTTPMMCAWLLQPGGAAQRPPGRLAALLGARLSARAAHLRAQPRLGARPAGGS